MEQTTHRPSILIYGKPTTAATTTGVFLEAWISPHSHVIWHPAVASRGAAGLQGIRRNRAVLFPSIQIRGAEDPRFDFFEEERMAYNRNAASLGRHLAARMDVLDSSAAKGHLLSHNHCRNEIVDWPHTPADCRSRSP